MGVDMFPDADVEYAFGNASYCLECHNNTVRSAGTEAQWCGNALCPSNQDKESIKT